MATVYSVSLGVLPPVLAAWHRAHEGVRIRLFEHRHAEELQAAMVAGEADLAIGPGPTGWPGPVRSLGEEEFVVVLAADDPLAGPGARAGEDQAGEVQAGDDRAGDDRIGEVRGEAVVAGGSRSGGPGASGRLALGVLADRDWVHYAPGHGLADLLDGACAAAGFAPRAAVRTEQTATAPVLAAAGLGPALVPANILPPGFEGCVLRVDPPLRRPLTAYSRAEPDALTTAFLTMLTARARLVPDHLRALLR